jgi:tellurite resistance protein
MIHAQPALRNLGTALREAATKISTATREIKRREDEATSWMQRFIHREIEQRTLTRGPAYWDDTFPGLTAEERAERRISRMLTRATIAGVAAAAGATSAEVLSLVGEGVMVFAAIPIGLVSVGAEMVYTTALQIDLAFDLAAIYDVPFAHDDVGEISTLLALALGVELVSEPTRHDKPAEPGATKPWRVMRQMQRDDFSRGVARQVLQQSVLRNVIPVAGVLVSAVWNQVVLRRYAQFVHIAVRQRLALVRACAGVNLGHSETARIILDGAWLIASSDGALQHQEALALAKLIDTLTLPDRIAVHEESFSDDEEEWFERVMTLDSSARGVLVNVLALVACADSELTAPEQRFLRRLAKALPGYVDFDAISRLITSMREGEADAAVRAVSTPAPAGA